jgi:iron complex transport system ATP-binding protein
MPYFATPTTVATMPEHHTQVPVIQASNVSVIRDTRTTVDNVSLSVNESDRWVVLGPNGCGKTTLLKILSLYLHPSSGDISVNGQRLGDFDIRPVRRRLAYVSASLATELRPALTSHEVVMSAMYGALEVWWNDYTPADHARAHECLSQLNVAHLAHSPISLISSGELQRVLLARALMCDPIAILLDEPTARLDLGGREQVVRILDEFAHTNPQLPSVTVTHHVDEIPTSTTHCALMRDAQVLVAGPIEETLTSQNLSTCFGTPLALEQRPSGRWTAYAP